MNITAVLVIYNRDIRDSLTFISLCDNYSMHPGSFSGFKLMIYDNSNVRQNVDLKMPFDYEYIHDPKNGGLPIAYNSALGLANKPSCDWLLLLDQDSSLPDDFIFCLIRDLAKVDNDAAVKAVVPKMCYKGRFFSPSKVMIGGTHRPIDMKHVGAYPDEIFAIGSGSVVRASFMIDIGGFTELFWLDSLDRWLFYMIHKMHGRVFVSDSVIEHELSILSYDTFMNEKRYSNIIKYETLFMKLYKTKLDNVVYCFRLLKRSLFLYITSKNKRYAYITFHHLMSRLSS